MRIIDARSGKDVQVGTWITYPPPCVFREPPRRGCACALEPPEPPPGVVLPGHGRVDEDSYRLVAVHDRTLTTAEASLEFADGRKLQAPLRVRFLHPGFLFQRVAFVPS